MSGRNAVLHLQLSPQSSNSDYERRPRPHLFHRNRSTPTSDYHRSAPLTTSTVVLPLRLPPQSFTSNYHRSSPLPTTAAAPSSTSDHNHSPSFPIATAVQPSTSHYHCSLPPPSTTTHLQLPLSSSFSKPLGTCAKIPLLKLPPSYPNFS